MPETVISVSYSALPGLSDALAKVSEIGARDRQLVIVVARLMVAVMAAEHELVRAKQQLIHAHALRDDAGNLVPTAEGQGIALKNPTIFQIEQEDLGLQEVELRGGFRRLTPVDLASLTKYPDALTIARLWCVMEEDAVASPVG